MDAQTTRPLPLRPPPLQPPLTLPPHDIWDAWTSATAPSSPMPGQTTISLPATPRRTRSSPDVGLPRKRSLPLLRRPRSTPVRIPRREVPNVSLADYAAAELPDLTMFVRALLQFGPPVMRRTSRPPRPRGGAPEATKLYFSPSYSSSISHSSSSIASGFESPLNSRPSSPRPSSSSPLRRLALPSISTESLTDMDEGPGTSLGSMSVENSMDGFPNIPQIDCTIRQPQTTSSLLLRSICDLYVSVVCDYRRPQGNSDQRKDRECNR